MRKMPITGDSVLGNEGSLPFRGGVPKRLGVENRYTPGTMRTRVYGISPTKANCWSVVCVFGVSKVDTVDFGDSPNVRKKRRIGCRRYLDADGKKNQDVLRSEP